jgi:hypothetical protein
MLDNKTLPKSRSDVLGHLVAVEINRLIDTVPSLLTHKLILDLGPNKLIKYELFANTVKRYLDPRINFPYRSKDKLTSDLFGKSFQCSYELK